MKWATRAGVHIDRAACAWVIRRHIDADADFLFVDGLYEYQRRAVLLNRTPG